MGRTFTLIVQRERETGWLSGAVAELPGIFSRAPDLVTLERLITDAIKDHFKAMDKDARYSEIMEPWTLDISFKRG